MSEYNRMIVDPDELYSFCCQLSELSEKLMEQLRRTDAALETVAKEWQDEQFHKYRNEFIREHDNIESILELSKGIEEFIMHNIWRLTEVFPID